MLDSSVLDNFLSADELFVKASQSLKTCLSVNNKLRGKLVSSLESLITLDKRFKFTSVFCFVTDFNLLSYKLDKFLLKCCYIESLYIDIMSKQSKFTMLS